MKGSPFIIAPKKTEYIYIHIPYYRTLTLHEINANR